MRHEDRDRRGRDGGWALILYPGATEIWSGEVGWTKQLSYHFGAEYPASNVISWIAERLRTGGWVPLPYDYLNPELPKSEIRKWSGGFIDTKPPDTLVYQRDGWWRSASGNLVRYSFRYKHIGHVTPKHQSDLTDLEVVGAYVSAANGQEVQEAIKQFRSR